MVSTSSSFIDQLSNLDAQQVLFIVAVLTVIRFIVLKANGQWVNRVAEYLESGIVVVVLVWMVIRPFIGQAYFIPSQSMEPTLLGVNGVGDHILLNKFLYRASPPKRDDVVVFVAPPNALEGDPPDDSGGPIYFIKRLIGEPGDRIEVHAGVIFVAGAPYDHEDVREKFADAGLFGPDADTASDLQAGYHIKFVSQGVQINGATIIGPTQLASVLANNPNLPVRIVPGYVALNGKVLNEPFTAEDPDYDLKMYQGQSLKDLEPYGDPDYTLNGVEIDKSTYDQDALYATEPIPDGEYFMMGDNRNDSKDSTVWGLLDSSRVVGRAQVIFWPKNRVGIIH